MTEAELLELRLGITDTILSIFSLFFALISAYLAGLYFFLRQAPFLLKFTAFGLLSFGMLFIGLITLGVKLFGDGVLEALNDLPEASAPMDILNRPYPLGPYTIDFYNTAVGFGWFVAVLVYLALFVLTFIYDWNHVETIKD